MPPGFFPSGQDDALAYFQHAAESSQLPTFLYNIPELTGTRINLETVAAFADAGCMGGDQAERRRVRVSQGADHARKGKGLRGVLGFGRFARVQPEGRQTPKDSAPPPFLNAEVGHFYPAVSGSNLPGC